MIFLQLLINVRVNDGPSRISEKSRQSNVQIEEEGGAQQTYMSHRTSSCNKHARAKSIARTGRDRSCMPSRERCYLGVLPRDVFFDMHACVPSYSAGRPPETRAPFTWGEIKVWCTIGLVKQTIAGVRRHARGGPAQDVHVLALYAGAGTRTSMAPKTGGARSYSKRVVPMHACMHACMHALVLSIAMGGLCEGEMGF
jgi:hypothetical protein